MDLIGQKGIDAVTMKEIASLSGGPIASVYQYFPNKTAIIATLYERYISQLRTFMDCWDSAGLRSLMILPLPPICWWTLYWLRSRKSPCSGFD